MIFHPLLTKGKSASNGPRCLSSSAAVLPGEKLRYFSKSKETPVVVEPFRIEHIRKATATFSDAFENDPLTLYVNADEPRKGPIIRKVYRILLAATIGRPRKGGLSFTVNDGEAVCLASRSADETGKQPILERLLAILLVAVVGRISKVAMTKEQLKRQAEVQEKMQEIVKKTLSDRKEEMLHINVLATEPKSQGKGYGSALVATVTSIADAQGSATYLLSSNISNTAFYNSCGFVTVAAAYMGSDNPAWDHKPVVVPLMVREPQ